MPFPTYPKKLEYASWNKGKAPLTPETGIGEELKALRKGYDGIDGSLFDGLLAAKTADDLEAGMVEARKHFTSKVKPLHDALLAAARLMDKEAGKAQKSLTFPKASRKLIEEMSTEASNFAVAVRDYPDTCFRDAERALKTRNENIEKFCKIRRDAFAASERHFANQQQLAAKATEVAKEAEDLAGAAKAAAKDGKTDELEAAAGAARKLDPKVKKLQGEVKAAYDAMMADAVIKESRTTNPSDFKLDERDVAEVKDVWNQTTDRIRQQTRLHGESEALLKEAAADLETAADAASGATKSPNEVVALLEQLRAETQEELKTLEHNGKAVLGRADWLEKLRAGARDGNVDGTVKQAKAIIDEIQSNMAKVAERGERMNRYATKKVKALPEDMRNMRAVKPALDELRTLLLRVTSVTKKVAADGPKILQAYRDFVSEPVA